MKTTKFQLNRIGIVYVVTYMVYVDQVKGINSLRTQLFIWLLILISYAQKLPIITHANVSSGDRGLKFDISLSAESLLLYFICDVTVCVLCLFLAMPWFGLQGVIVVLPCHTQVLFFISIHMLRMRAVKTLVSLPESSDKYQNLVCWLIYSEKSVH